MRTKDRDRTALSAGSVLRVRAVAALFAGAAAGAAPARAAATAAPAAHDSAGVKHAQPSVATSDEPPPPAPAAGTAKPLAKRAVTAAKPAPGAAAPKAPAPVVAPVQAWHPPMAPPAQVAGAKPGSAPAAPVAGAKPAPVPTAPAVAVKPAPAAGVKPAPARVTPVAATKPVAPAAVATLKAAGAVPPPAGSPGTLAKAGAPGASAHPGTAPAVAASKALPAAAVAAAPVVAAAGAHAPLVVAPPAANPATFVGPPIPPGMAVRIGGGAAAPGIAQGPGRPTATTAGLHPMTVNLKPVAGTSSTLSHLDEHLTYQYNALGRRDPFQPLIGGGFVYANEGGDALPDIGGLKIVGIVWGTDDQFAMAEDARGESMVLRRGDKVMNGVVQSLKRDGVVVNLTVDGQTQSVVIPLSKKGEK